MEKLNDDAVLASIYSIKNKKVPFRDQNVTPQEIEVTDKVPK